MPFLYATGFHTWPLPTSFEQSSLVSEFGVGSGPYRWKVIVPLMSEVPPDRVDESDRSVPLTPSVKIGRASCRDRVGRGAVAGRSVDRVRLVEGGCGGWWR